MRSQLKRASICKLAQGRYCGARDERLELFGWFAVLVLMHVMSEWDARLQEGSDWKCR
jgi:hypothetical protein